MGNANTNLSFLLRQHSIKMSQIRINSKHFIFITIIYRGNFATTIAGLMLDRNYTGNTIVPILTTANLIIPKNDQEQILRCDNNAL